MSKDNFAKEFDSKITSIDYSDIGCQQAKLHALANDLYLNGQPIWAGNHKNMLDVYNALDIATSTCGEGFPKVVGEAMACGVPCVLMDVIRCK